MTQEETNCFTLLDNYARARHKCILTEFFLSTIEVDEYVLCFRPTGLSVDSPKYRYAYRYFYIDTDVVRTAGRNKKLPECITELLDKELPRLAGT